MNQENKKKPRKKEKWNFKPWLIIAAIILVIVALAAILTYCDGNGKQVLNFSYENGKYIDQKNDITYVEAPVYYQAKLTTSKDYPYAESDRDTLYRVGYRDEDEKVHLVSGNFWLSTLIEDGSLLYYNPDKVELPEMNEFEGDTIYVCRPDGTLFTTTLLEGTTVTELLDTFLTAESEPYAMLALGCELVSNLKVSSSKYNWMYLNLWLYTDAEGNYYISEATTQRVVKTDAKVFEPIFAETTTES